MSKINIYKSGSDKWKDALFSHVDPDIFPKCFGGNYVEDGDERCPSKVNNFKKILYINLLRGYKTHTNI